MSPDQMLYLLATEKVSHARTSYRNMLYKIAPTAHSSQEEESLYESGVLLSEVLCPPSCSLN